MPTADASRIDQGSAGRQAGFTLVEVLISVFLVTGGLLAFGILSGSLIEKNIKSTRQSIGVTLAQDKIEELRNLTLQYKNLSAAALETNPVYSGGWTSASPQQLDSEGGATGPLQYTRKWTVEEAAGSQGSAGGGSHLYDVQVTVSWVSAGNKSVTLDTRITD